MNEIPNLNNSRRSVPRCIVGWLFSRRIMRRILISVVALITFIAAIYAVIDWRGKQRWETCKRELAAQGEAVDWSAYVPNPVPDDQNIFKAPKMAEWFCDDHRGIIDQPLEHRLTNDFAHRFLNTSTTAEITSTQAAAVYLAWSDQFQNDFNTISVALQRPFARMDADYSQPLTVPLPNVVTLGVVAKTLVQRANCHLLLGETEKAWQEVNLLHDLLRMVEGQGKFLTTEGEWMRAEGIRYWLEPVARGLELHAWSEPQLVTLQQQLKDSDIIPYFADALRCGRTLLFSSFDSGAAWSQALYGSGGDGFWKRLKKHPELLLYLLAPRGVIYGNVVDKAGRWARAINSLNPSDGIFRPGDVSDAFAWWKRAQQGLPNVLRLQTLVNEGQVACALERYRLAHHEYPETLDALTPQFIGKLPPDIINGKPLVYRRNNDGSFLLYSVGWNHTDDGGQIVLGEAGHTKMTEGDWVWKSYRD